MKATTTYDNYSFFKEWQSKHITIQIGAFLCIGLIYDLDKLDGEHQLGVLLPFINIIFHWSSSQ